MLLSTIASVFSALLITQGTLAALTPAQVVTNVNIVAALSADTDTALSQLSTSSTPSDASAIGRVSRVPCFNGTILTRFAEQSLVSNFQQIIKDLTGDVTAMKDTPPFVDGVTARSPMPATPASADDVTQPIIDALTNVSTNS